jgi:putative holliday junction resolvase
MKILGLDIGDRWTGIAISDPLGMISRPHSTVLTTVLIDALHTLLNTEKIHTIIIGYPKTMRGTESDQTRKVTTYVSLLKEHFPFITFILWDERLTSKHAASIKPIKNKQDKEKSHALAAALILQSYLLSKPMITE